MLGRIYAAHSQVALKSSIVDHGRGRRRDHTSTERDIVRTKGGIKVHGS